MPGRLSHCCLFVSTDHQPAGCCCTLNTNFCRVFADWWRAGRDGLEQGKFLGSADALTRRARPVAPHLIKHWLFPAEPGATAPALVHAARRHVVSTRTPAGSGAARQTLAEDTAVTRREALRTYGSSSAPSLSEPLLGTTPSCPDCSAPIADRVVWHCGMAKKKRSFSSHSRVAPPRLLFLALRGFESRGYGLACAGAAMLGALGQGVGGGQAGRRAGAGAAPGCDVRAVSAGGCLARAKLCRSCARRTAGDARRHGVCAQGKGGRRLCRALSRPAYLWLTLQCYLLSAQARQGNIIDSGLLGERSDRVAAWRTRLRKS